MRGARGRVAAGILACVASTLVPTTGAWAGVPNLDPAPATVTIVSQPFNILTSVNATFTIVPPSNVSLNRNDRIEVRLHRRVASRDSLRTIADGLAVPSVIDRHSVRISSVGRDASGRLSPVVPIAFVEDRRSLVVPYDGIYPVSVALVDGTSGEDLASTLTFVNRRDATASNSEVQAGVVVRLRAEPSLRPDGTVAITDRLRDDVARLTTFLAEISAPVTVALQPESIAALGDAVEPGDATLFQALRQQLAGRTVTAAPFAAVDPALMAALDLDDEYIEQLRFGTAVLSRYLPGVPVKSDTLFVTTPLDRPTIALLRKAGVTNIVLSPTARQATESEARPSVVSRPGGRDNEFISLVSVDQVAADLMSTPTASAVATGHRIAAELIAERDDLVASGVSPEWIRIVAASGSGTLPDDGVLSVVTRSLAGAPGLKLTDLTNRQFVSPNHPATVFQPTIEDPGNARRAGLTGARRELTAVSSMTNDDDPRRETWSRLLAVGASESVPDPSEWISSLRASMRQTRESVVVITPANITLSSRTTSIRLQVRNESDAPLTIRVRLSSAKLELTDPARTVSLPARTLTEIEVPATTRTNGRFPVTVRITTPEGGLEVLPTIRITARVTAIAGLGQLVTISLLLVLLAWWWSHRRSARTGTDGDTSTGDDPADARDDAPGATVKRV